MNNYNGKHMNSCTHAQTHTYTLTHSHPTHPAPVKQDALSQLRGVSSGLGGRTSETIETLQSRAREWEKKVCLSSFFCHSLSISIAVALSVSVMYSFEHEARIIIAKKPKKKCCRCCCLVYSCVSDLSFYILFLCCKR